MPRRLGVLPVSATRSASQRHTRLWLTLGPIGLGLLVVLAFQGSRGLAETSETRYAEVAREMLVTGNWLEPSLRFEPHWTKPPFAYWCMALGMEIFGTNEWGARLPGALAYLIAVWAVQKSGQVLWSARAGCYAGLAFALGFPVVGAAFVTTDIYVTATAAVGMLAFVQARQSSEVSTQRWCIRWMWCALGVGFLIKGPPVVLPLLAMGAWTYLQPRATRLPLWDGLGVLMFLGIALSWFVWVVLRHPDLLDYYLGREIVARVTSDLGHNRQWWKAFPVYLPPMIFAVGAFGPWAAIVAWRAGWNRSARWKELWQVRDERLLLVAWITLPLAVFSVSSSKLPFYVLPLAVPMALLVGHILATRARWRTVCQTALVSTLFVVSLKATAAYQPHPNDMRSAAQAASAELQQMAPEAALVVWGEPNNHGLEFYLQLGPEALPEHVLSTTADVFLERWNAGAYPQGVLLVVSERKRDSAAFAAFAARLPIESERSGSPWRLLRVRHTVAGG